MTELRIVLLVSRYPPHHKEGAERRAEGVARELARRGHTVQVLTSTPTGKSSREQEGPLTIVRTLRLGDDATRSLSSIGGDCRRLRAELRDADVLLLSHCTGLTAALFAVAEDFGRTCFDVASDWLSVAGSPQHPWYVRWRPPADGGRLGYRMKRASAEKMLGIPIRPVPLPFGRSWFWSRGRWKRCLAAGLGVHGSAVLEPGIDVRRFAYTPHAIPEGDVRVLFIDPVERGSGLHTAVLALGDLPSRVRLRISGEVKDEPYLYETAELGRAAGSFDRIEITAPNSLGDLPAAIADSDVLVHAAEEPQRFPRHVLEAFSVGIPVIAADPPAEKGEVFVHGENALTFAPGNAPELARRLTALLADDDARAKQVAAARACVEHKFALAYSVDQIEPEIRAAASAETSAG